MQQERREGADVSTDLENPRAHGKLAPMRERHVEGEHDLAWRVERHVEGGGSTTMSSLEVASCAEA
eukprot:440125-Heterocapsa_arctica.AAC.1